MKRLLLAWLLASAPAASTQVVSAVAPVATSATLQALLVLLWQPAGARAQGGDVSAKEAFEAAKELGTVEAWNAFLNTYSTGFYADLARAYLQRLNSGGA